MLTIIVSRGKDKEKSRKRKTFGYYFESEEQDRTGVHVLLGEFALHVLDCRLEEE